MGTAGSACVTPCCAASCCEHTGEKTNDFVKVVHVAASSETGLVDATSTAETSCGDYGEDVRSFPGGAGSTEWHGRAEAASSYAENGRNASAVPPDLAVDIVEEAPALWDAKEVATSSVSGLRAMAPAGSAAVSAGAAAALEEGHRVETYEDGSVYEGKHVRGLRHGRGIWRSDEESYDGQWADDHRHGAGRQTWRDGRVFVGQFADGSFGGHGRMEWRSPNGELTVFEGQYVADLKHGHGRFQWPDGRVYDGEWRSGMRTGRAQFTNTQGMTRMGLWKEDALVRWLGPDE